MNTEEIMKLADAMAVKAVFKHDHPTTGTIHEYDEARAALEAALGAKQGKQEPCGYDETTGNCTRNPCCHPAPEAKKDAYDLGFCRGLEASASYREEARAYKEAYFKLVENVASLKVMEPPPPIILTHPIESPHMAVLNKQLLKALKRIVDYEHDFCVHPEDLREIARAAIAEASTQPEIQTDTLERKDAALLKALKDIAHGLEKARVWGGMEWHYNPLHPFIYLPLRDKARAAIAAAEGETK